MQQRVTVNIDGALVRAAKGSSVLDAALEHGICIPHLCHLHNVSDIGACRLCVVEQVVDGRSRVTASCTLRVEEGMVIRSSTQGILRLRRNIAELLVAQAPNSRVIQDLANICGVERVRYPFRNEKCVLCGRCVRVCSEVWKIGAIGFVGRGKERHVDFPFGVRPDSCRQCDKCLQACPMKIKP